MVYRWWKKKDKKGKEKATPISAAQEYEEERYCRIRTFIELSEPEKRKSLMIWSRQIHHQLLHRTIIKLIVLIVLQKTDNLDT
jgi:hypothetical protein